MHFQPLATLACLSFLTTTSIAAPAIASVSSAAPKKAIPDMWPAYTDLFSAKWAFWTKGAKSVFPEKATGDAPYTFNELILRSAIKVPVTFERGTKKPVILVAGSGVSGIAAFRDNYLTQWTNSPFVDPIILELPDKSMGDAQEHAEFVAYAVNYISAISKDAPVSVITFAQGSVNMQWALKYWPSTRAAMEDFIAIAPDFKGTTVAGTFDNLLNTYYLPPAIFQQAPNSKFITTLRADGGDSAYVPTTTIYSSDDTVLTPQNSNDSSTGFMKDTRRVGVSNYLVQDVCRDKPAGMNVTHEGLLINSLAFAAAFDALTYRGPAELMRIDLDWVCGQSIARGLVADDIRPIDYNLETMEAMVKFAPLLVKEEPPLKEYVGKQVM